MEPILSQAQMQAVDRAAIQRGIPELILMEHAAIALVDSLKRRFQGALSTSKGLILAGTGNNGGDALAAARILSHLEVPLFVVLSGEPNRCSPSCSQQLKMLSGLRVAWGRKVDRDLIDACDWLIDGLLGTGLTREVDGELRETINLVNEVGQNKWVVAADIPSGLCADTGVPLGVAIKACETVSFGFLKRGLVTGQAADYVGNLHLASIQIPRDLPFSVDTFLYNKRDAAKLPFRRPTSHKGIFGHVYVWGGRAETEGAGVLASMGALRSGAGLVTLIGSRNTLTPPEIMTLTANDFLFEEEGVLILGPGMGTSEAEKKILEKALTSSLFLVVDADALTLISKDKSLQALLLKREGRQVLTPHPKEAARLLATSALEIEKDRYLSVRRLSDEFQSAVILKGKGSLSAFVKGPTVVTECGDTGLSKGGTGDLLSGMVGSFLAQGMRTEHAVPLAMHVHGRASEILTARRGTSRTTLASEIADAIALVFSELENNSGK